MKHQGIGFFYPTTEKNDILHVVESAQLTQTHLVVLQCFYQILICFEQRDSSAGMSLI